MHNQTNALKGGQINAAVSKLYFAATGNAGNSSVVTPRGAATLSLAARHMALGWPTGPCGRRSPCVMLGVSTPFCTKPSRPRPTSSATSNPPAPLGNALALMALMVVGGEARKQIGELLNKGRLEIDQLGRSLLRSALTRRDCKTFIDYIMLQMLTTNRLHATQRRARQFCRASRSHGFERCLTS